MPRKAKEEIIEISKEVIGLLKGKDIYNDRYIVRFKDGSIDNNIMSVELDFDYKKEIERKTNQKNKERSR